MKFAFALIALITGAVAGFSAAAIADPLVTLTPNPGNTFNNANGYSLGFGFVVSSSITVDALGYFDTGVLTENHSIGLYDSTQSLLASALVTSASPVSNSFAYTAIPDVLLNPGTYYLMGTSGFVDPYTFSPTASSVDPRASFAASAYSDGNSLQFPDTVDPTTFGYFGPNLDISTQVPEPFTLSLFGGGLAGLVAVRRCKRAKKA